MTNLEIAINDVMTSLKHDWLNTSAYNREEDGRLFAAYELAKEMHTIKNAIATLWYGE